MYFGVDYYPEHWPRERWAKDVQLMKEANMNVVRMAEFAWAVMEPQEGVYDFRWLDDIIAICEKAGIDVVLGTPTATPPKWLVNQYPDILMQDSKGHARGFGSRRHYCYNNPDYRRLSQGIAEKMAARYEGHSAVIAWQIDNEFGCHDTARCFCSHCHQAFQDWLKEKYTSIGQLNEAWGTVFWSQTYSNWSDVILPSYTVCDTQAPGQANHNPGLLLDFYRFSSDSAVSYQQLQIDVLRKHSEKPITHNLMGHFSQLDYFDLSRDLDFVSWDNYPSNQWGTNSHQSVAMAHALMWGVKNKNFWVMEQQSGPCGWNAMGRTPRPGQLRLWSYQALAHGAEALVYFRWRACLFGTEQYWHGVLDHDGVPRRRYRELAATGAELHSLSTFFEDSVVKAETALLKSYDSLWSHEFQPHTAGFDYNGTLLQYYQALSDQHIPCHVTGVHSDLKHYKLVIAPALNVMDTELQEQLQAYVEDGGNLVITFRSGTRHSDNSMTETPIPGYFQAMAGIEVEEFDVLNNKETAAVTGVFGQGAASAWADVIRCCGAEALARYSSQFYAGRAAVTSNQVGRGKVYYIGCDLDGPAVLRLLGYISRQAGAEPALKHPSPGVEAVPKKSADGSDYLVLLNHNDHDVTVSVERAYRDLLGEKEGSGEFLLKPYGAAVLQYH